MTLRSPPPCRACLRAVCAGGLCLLLAGGGLRADEQVRRIQEELRKRNLYFGEVDGRRSEAVEAALRHYRQRKGIPEGDDFTPQTLASLGVAPAPADPAWPEMPVLKSDAARGSREEGLIGPVPQPIEPPPPPIAEEPMPTEEAPPAPTPAVVPPRPRLLAEEVPLAQVAQFIRHYLEVCETNQLEREMSFYAEPLRYFEHGDVTRKFVQSDVARYYKRWPHRKYTLLSLKVAPAPGDPGAYFARFRIRFDVESERGHAGGQTDNLFKVRVEPAGLKLVALQEYRVRG